MNKKVFEWKKIGFALFLVYFSTTIIAQDNTAPKASTETKVSYPVYPQVNYGTGQKAAQILRGEYLTKASDCIACHTENNGIAFSGGLPIKTPFGTLYAPNITPDKQTGIGNWADKDFLRALHEGKNPKGQFYFPAFPYPYFNKMSDQDVADIHAYLNAIVPIHKESHAQELHWPFSLRILQAFWRILYFDFQKGQFVPNPNRSAEWNRGAYLVDGPAHCGLCHTKLSFLGAPIKKYYLAGGNVDGYYAPNITSATLANVPVEKIVDVFLKDQLIHGGPVQGPMLEVNHDSLKYLTVEDLRSIATYLKTVVSESPPVPKAEGADAGKSIYQTYCAGCHAAGSGGAPKFGDANDWGPLIQGGMENLYKNAITGIGGMPPKGMCTSCSDAQIKQTVDYIITNSKPKAGQVITAAKPSAEQKYTSLQKGKEVYDQVCSICHAEGKLGSPRMGDQSVWSALVRQNEMDGLFNHAIHGYKGHPVMGACYKCTDADVIAAVKYMVQQSVPSGDFRLW